MQEISVFFMWILHFFDFLGKFLCLHFYLFLRMHFTAINCFFFAFFYNFSFPLRMNKKSISFILLSVCLFEFPIYNLYNFLFISIYLHYSFLSRFRVRLYRRCGGTSLDQTAAHGHRFRSERDNGSDARSGHNYAGCCGAAGDWLAVFIFCIF